MKKILFLALIFALVSCLLTGCDETDGADDANTLPPTQQDNAAGDNDSVSDKTESESSGSGNGSQSGNTDTGSDNGDDALVDINGDGSAEVTLAPNITSSADSDVLTPDGTTADSLGSSLSEEISDAVGDMENGGGFIGAIIAIVVVIAIIIAVIALIPKKKM